MDTNQPAILSARTLLRLPVDSGRRFPEEWEITARRMAVVHGAAVAHDTEPAGAPRLDTPDD